MLECQAEGIEYYKYIEGAKEAWKGYENIEISTSHRVRQRAGTLEIAPTVAINARHNIDGKNACRLRVGAPIALASSPC